LSNGGNVSVVRGNNVTDSVTATLASGTAQAVSYSVSGLPTGVTASFNPTSCTPTCSTTLTLTASATATIGPATITVTGTAGAVTHTTSFTLTVSAAPDFAISATPPSQTVTQGNATNYSITLTPSGGFSGNVTLSVTGLPTGATGTFTPNPATGSSTLAVTTAASTPTGPSTLTITGVSGALTHSTTVSLSVTSSNPPPTAVSFDAMGPGAAGTSVDSGSSVTWNHTVSSLSNGLLTVGAAIGRAGDTGLSLAVTYNGVPMTSAGIVHTNSRTDGFVQLFYLKAPAPGTHAVVVTLTGGTAAMNAGSVSFTGVDQTTPVRNITTNTGVGTTPAVTVASASGDMVVDAFASGCTGTFSSSQSLRWLGQVDCDTGGGNGGQSTATGAAAVTMGYTIPDDWWGIIGMDVVASTH
jgi:hypothetical protein